MVDLKAIVEQNSELKKDGPKSPVGVFVGGTAGIGRSAAMEFAKNTKSPTIYIVGRNITAAESLIEQLRHTEESGKYYFLKHDTSSIKECDKLCSVIRGKEKKINLLYVSAGVLSTGKYKETEEGLEWRLATNYYGRWRIISELLPLVQKAADKKEFSRVVTVLGGGEEGKVDTEDYSLKQKYSFLRLFRHNATFNSLAVMRFSKLYPDVSFTHIFPGFVAGTEISRNLVWPLGSILHGIEPILATPAEDFAKISLYIGAGGKEYAQGSFILNEKLKDMKDKAVKKGYLTPELSESVWKHTQKVYEDILSD